MKVASDSTLTTKKDSIIKSNKLDLNDKPEVINDSVDQLIDSNIIGVKGNNKIDIKQIRTEDGHFVKFDLYTLRNKKWIHTQNYLKEKDGITSLDIIIFDYNKDGYNDITFRSGIAARGANEIRTLCIFNKKDNQLRIIKNSYKYPNLRYNNELKCIDAWLVFGGSSSVFLKIENDSLREFAGVTLFDNMIEIYEVDKKANRRILSKEINFEIDEYTRFSNYNPLKITENNKNDHQHMVENSGGSVELESAED